MYQLLLLVLATTVLYALHSWRLFLDRERSIDELRPFVASEHLYDRLLDSTPSPEMDTARPFRALCKDVLEARSGYLVPLGPIATLTTHTLSHPEDREVSEALLVSLRELAARFSSPHMMCLAVDPERHGGAVWAIPLWSERGLIGLLLIAEKEDGSLYTQEEIEIARAAGERLIDIQASSEMTRRLIFLQRQRLVESQVLDRRARRVLHDDVLPRLHTAMLTLSRAKNGSTGADREAAVQLAEVHREIADLLSEIPSSAAPQVARLGLVASLRQEATNYLTHDLDAITWSFDPDAERLVAGLSPLAEEVLFGAAREAMRNAARYGRNGDPSRPLHLTISLANRDGLELTVTDDGVGVGYAAAVPAGSGQGLALHSTLMAVIGGALSVESVPQQHTRVVLTLPHPSDD
ncbi:MAG: hypothetical protein GEU73_15600 [Chloroflexi bacterium]|nr:hypothetical protein [Chloroflexota bacterium]